MAAAGRLIVSGIGYYFGGPVGYAIGSYLGSQLFPTELPTAEGPRLADLSVQGSNYGATLPITYGTTRMAGNVIWSSDLKETRHTESAGGGKGGGGTTQQQTTYTYAVDMATALCEGPIKGIGRIWADGKLLNDNSYTGPSNDLLIAGLVMAIKNNQSQQNKRVYLGDETQLPDPTIESYEGVGNTPAYRGTANVTSENFQLKDFGNRIPNMTFEVIKDGALVPVTPRYTNVGPQCENGFLIEWQGVLRTYGGLNAQQWWTSDFNEWQREVVDLPAGGDPNRFWMVKKDGYLYKLDGGASSSNVWRSRDGITWEGLLPPYLGDATPTVKPWGTDDIVGAIVYAGYIWRLSYTGSVWRSTDGVYWDRIVAPGSIAVLNGLSYVGLYVVNGAVVMVAHNNTFASVLDVGVYSTTDFINWTTLPAPPFHAAVMFSYSVPSGVQTGDRAYYVAFDNASTVDNSIFYTVDGGQSWVSTGASWSSNSGATLGQFHNIPCFIVNPLGLGDYQNIGGTYYETMQSGVANLSDVVTDICARANLTPAQVDASALTGTVDGYVINRGSSARAALEPLRQAYHFDVAESGSVIKFIPRGGAVQRTIAWDDLAAHAGGGQQPTPYQASRQQEVELPREVVVKYLSKSRDYQSSSQRSQRLTTDSVQKMDITLPMVLDDTTARRAAEIIQYESWVGRTGYTFTLPAEYIDLEPGDVVVLPLDAQSVNTVRLRITRIDYQPPGLLKIEGSADDDALYNSLVVGEAGAYAGQTLAADTPTLVVILDTPILRDLDSDSGFYLAACGYNTSWRGGRIYQSSDGGATWLPLVDVVTPATIGQVPLAIGGASTNIWDRGSRLTTRLYNGDLTSDTELNVLNGANAAFYGAPGRWELISWANATLNADGTHTLDTLLRGQRGTEWAVGLHQVNDLIVVLSTATIQRISADSASIGLAREYKGITNGHTLDYGQPVNATNQALGLKPYSPAHVAGKRNAAGDLTVTWTRRTRIAGQWTDLADVPLGEQSESYEVDILDGTTVLRTLTATTPSVVYTAADQVTDFGAAQGQITVRIYQMSATLGRGYKHEARL